MEFALSEDGVRIKATKTAEGFCDMCGKPLIPKCGSIYKHHWAHKAGKDCDPWWEPESDWHRNWKNLVDETFREIVIQKNGVKHRADICLLSGIVVELQNSPLSFDERCEREAFYENMIWIIHLPKAKIELIEYCYEKDLFDDYYAQIKNINEWISQPPHPSPIFLDFDDDGKIFHITEFDEYSSKIRTRNLYGKYIDKKKFINFLKPTFFDFDLSKITLSHFHRDFEALQKKLNAAQEQLREVKEQLRTAKQQKMDEERAEERKRQNEKLAEERRNQNEESRKKFEEETRKRQEIINFINKTISEYTWGVYTEQDAKAAALLEELKKQPKKKPWEN